MKGLPLRLAAARLGAVGRSLLGVLLAAAAGLQWGSAGAATAAAGAAAIAGATALQDSPRGPLRPGGRHLGADGRRGAARHVDVVLRRALRARGDGVVLRRRPAVGGERQRRADRRGGGGAARHRAAGRADPVVGGARRPLLALGGGLVQAVLIGLWPRRRWRLQRDALDAGVPLARRRCAAPRRRSGRAGRPGAADLAARRVHPDRRQARRRPLAYRAWYGLPRADRRHADGAGGQVVGRPGGGRACCALPRRCWTSSRGRSRNASGTPRLGVMRWSAATDAVAAAERGAGATSVRPTARRGGAAVRRARPPTSTDVARARTPRRAVRRCRSPRPRSDRT